MILKNKKYILKFKLISIILILILTFSNIVISKNETTNDNIIINYSFNAPHTEKIIINDITYDKVILKDTINLDEPGNPCLPIKGAYILLPKDKSVNNIKIETDELVYLGSEFYVEPASESIPLSMSESNSPPIPNPEIYNSKSEYPKNNYKEIGTYIFRGYKILVLELYPVKYVPNTGDLFYYPRLTVSIETIEDNKDTSSYRGLKRDELEVIKKVDNLDVINTYDLSSKDITNMENEYNLLIITTDSLKNGFEPLKNAHDLEGIKTIIKTLTDVGGEKPEDIRDFIKNAYNNLGIEYVLIGGDDDIIPARTLWVSGLDEGTTLYETYMPSDLYYACLDGSFNFDNDNKWGEPNDGENGDDVDLFAEVYIGRACVGDAEELDNFIYKTISQIDLLQKKDPYLQEYLFVGEELGPYGIAQWAGNYLDQLIDNSTDDGYQTTGIPTNDFNINTLYDRNNFWSYYDLIDIINNDVYVINHDGHSNYYYNMKMDVSDIYELNNDKYNFIYSQGCMAGGFDRDDCIAETMTVKTKNGAFAGIWNARYGWFWSFSTDGDSQRFHREFWDAVFGEKITEIGKANQDSKEDNLYIIERSCIRWCYYQLNLFGDPSLSFYNIKPNKPQKPIGEGKGEEGIEYIYSTFSNDPNNLQIYYKWDWDDGTISEWLGPYESGEESSASHNWSKGRYEIRVKAMNINGYESPWSDPLPVSMPKNKIKNLYLIDICNKLKNFFPIFEYLNNYLMEIYK